MSNTTFRRHFPRQAGEIAEARCRREPPAGEQTRPGPYEILVARNARLRRANRTLTGNLRLAAAQIQRLGIENARLREALEASSGITRIGLPGSSRGHLGQIPWIAQHHDGPCSRPAIPGGWRQNETA